MHGTNKTIPRRASLARLLPCVLLHAICVGLLMPVLPVLIRELAQVEIASASVYGGWLTALYAGAQFLAAPLLGNLGDRYGRRPVLLVSFVAFCACYVLLALSVSLHWLFAAQLLAGSFAATTSAGAAYIADVTDESTRARDFGRMGATYGMGLTIGPLLSASLIDSGLRWPCYVAAALALCNVLYVWLYLPESLSVTQRRPLQLWRSHLPGVLQELRRGTGVLALLGATLLFHVGIQVMPTVWPYFTMQQFDWSPREVGYSLGAFGLTGIVTQGVILGTCTARFGLQRTVYLGLGLIALAFLGVALAQNSLMVSLCIVPAAVGLMSGPALTGLMANRLPANAQGALQGAVAAVISVAAIVTPLLMPRLFQAGSQNDAAVQLPGLPYLLAMMLVIASLLVIRYGSRRDMAQG